MLFRSGYLSGGWNPKTQTPDFKTGVDIAMNPLLLRISLEDAFNSAASDAYPSKAVRQSSMGFTLGTSSLPFSGGRFDLGFSGAVQAWTESLNTSDRYEDWDLALAYTGVFAGWQDTKQVFSKPGLYKGYSLVGTVRCLAPVLPMPSNPRFGIEVQAMVASGFLGLQANSYAGLSFSEDLGYGPNGAVIQTDTLGVVSIQTYPLYEEFKDGSTGTWYMQSEVAIRAFSKELQQAAGPVYIRRLNLRTGFRASLTNGFNGFGEYSVADNSLFNWSIFSRLELDFTPALGALALTRPVAWVEFWYRPLDETWGLGYVRELSF